MAKRCLVHWLGQVAYQEAWGLQRRLADEIAVGLRPATLLLLEHPHTYTFGRRGQVENLLWDESQLTQHGVSVEWVDRGGDVTYHGPGQLVGYPLLQLDISGLQRDPASGRPRLPKADYTGYLRNLETTLIQALHQFGLVCCPLDGMTGVWVQPEDYPRGAASSPGWSGKPAKVAAIGVKVDARGLTQHGFALNVNPDMRYWDGIIGCGLHGYPITCLADLLDPSPDMAIVRQAVISAFGRVFNFEMVEEAL